MCVWGGYDSRPALPPPAVITDPCALYACASRGLCLLHNTASAAEDASRREPDPPRARKEWVGGGREVRKCPWVLSLRDVAPNGAEKEKEGEEDFLEWFLTSPT